MSKKKDFFKKGLSLHLMFVALSCLLVACYIPDYHEVTGHWRTDRHSAFGAQFEYIFLPDGTGKRITDRHNCECCREVTTEFEWFGGIDNTPVIIRVTYMSIIDVAEWHSAIEYTFSIDGDVATVRSSNVGTVAHIVYRID